MSSSQVVSAPKTAGRFRRWVGNFGWPILLRELQADFRKNRFLLTHSLCMCLLGMVVLVLVAHQVEAGSTPTEIGQRLFSLFFVVQYVVILIVFPAFSAASFAEERNRFTLDLLLTTTLRPSEIVWGKFLSATVYCLLYVVTSIPLMSVAFLFGGITLEEVFFAYGVLILATLLVSVLGVCVSSCLGTSIRSTLAMYVLVFAWLAFSWILYDQLQSEQELLSIVRKLQVYLGFGEEGFYLKLSALGLILVAVFSYLFIITTNRIRPPADNKATALRILTFASVTAILGTYAWHSWVTMQARDPEGIILLAMFVLLVVAWIFPTEEAYVSRRSQRTFRSWSGIRYPFRVFAPGAFWGFLYAATLSLVVCGGLYTLWVGFVEIEGSSDRVFVSQEMNEAIRASLTTLPFYLLAVAAAGFFLGACDFSPLYARLTVIFVFIITLLLPVIFWVSDQKDTLWTLYFMSPITVWNSIKPDGNGIPRSEITYQLFDLPVIDLAKIFFGLIAVVFFVAGVRLCCRAGYPLCRFDGVVKKTVSTKPAIADSAAATPTA